MLLDKTFKSLLEERKILNKVFEINTELPSPQMFEGQSWNKIHKIGREITSCRQQ